MKVFLATPAYDGRVTSGFERSLRESLELMRSHDLPAHWEAFSGCCYLPVARNKLVKRFLESDATDLIFVDADIEWMPQDLLRLLSWPVEIVGGVYRVKEDDERYPVWIKTDPDGFPILGGLSELIECWGLPTGFLRIARSVFDAMERHYGSALEVDEYGDIPGEKIGSYLNFFDTAKIGRQWFGEDIHFCRRWTMEMGRSLWADPMIPLTHWGTWPSGHPKAYRGDWHDYLSRLPGGANDPGYQAQPIPGYVTKREVQWLYARAKEMESIVEIGTFAGKSAHALLSGCPGPVYCVDPWQPIEWDSNDTIETAENRMRTFLAATAQFPNRRVMRMLSIDAAKQFSESAVDMVWIDGDHSLNAVMADIEAWLPKTRKLLCGHDYDEWGWPAVKQAVDEVFGNAVQVYESIWYVEF